VADDRLADLRLTPAQGRVLSYLRQGAGPLWRSSLPGAGILADVAIFDEAHFITRASYLKPQVYAEGMRHGRRPGHGDPRRAGAGALGPPVNVDERYPHGRRKPPGGHTQYII
jgi:hypothetical protein